MTFVVDVVSCFSEDEPYSNDCGRPTDLWHHLFSIRHLMRIHMVIHCPQKMIPNDYGAYFDLCIVPLPVQIFHWIFHSKTQSVTIITEKHLLGTVNDNTHTHEGSNNKKLKKEVIWFSDSDSWCSDQYNFIFEVYMWRLLYGSSSAKHENHQLIMESSRYFPIQLVFDLRTCPQENLTWRCY